MMSVPKLEVSDIQVTILRPRPSPYKGEGRSRESRAFEDCYCGECGVTEDSFSREGG